MYRKALLILVLSGGAAGCAPGVSYQEAPPQVVAQTGAFGLLRQGKVGETDYLLEFVVRVFPQDGKLGVCGAARVMAATDITANIAEGLAYRDTTLTISAEDGGQPVVLSPRFVRVGYLQKAVHPKNIDSDIGALVGRRDQSPAPCVITDEPWQDIFGTSKLFAKLWLLTRETRVRTRTVVGAP